MCGVLEVLPVLLKICDEMILVIIVYRKPGSIGSFLEDLSQVINEFLPKEYRILLVGDFNLDPMLTENCNKLDSFKETFSFSQRSHYSTYIYGGILDLVFDSSMSESVSWMPSPYTDHFVLLVQL